MEVELDYGNEPEDIERTVYLNQDDICIDCQQQYGCPLIECLANGLVEQTQPIKVVDCRHYFKFNWN